MTVCRYDRNSGCGTTIARAVLLRLSVASPCLCMGNREHHTSPLHRAIGSEHSSPLDGQFVQPLHAISEPLKQTAFGFDGLHIIVEKLLGVVLAPR
jgi:hypothetical protein